MKTRRVGLTDIEVSVIGLGTVKLGRNQGVKYPQAFSLPTDNEVKKLLECAKELGINLLDTAPAYGESETRLGKWLRGQRHEWVLSTKVGETFTEGESHFDFSPQAINRSIDRSLAALQTDYLDIVLVHSNGNDLRLIDEEAVFFSLEKLKKTGKIRTFGMSTKSIAGGLATLAVADVAMVSFNPEYLDEREVLQYAAAHHKGILVKKALASGHLAPQKMGEALSFILAEPGVSSVILGTINPQHLSDNIRALALR